MSLEQKLGFLNRFKSALASSCAAYSLAVSLALGAAFYGCGKGDEPGEENQRYACQMNECVPDSNGPYAVSDCNNECGEDNGNGLPMDYLTATKNGMPICPLGWTQGTFAHAQAESINVVGMCGGGGFIQMYFQPTPSPGGSAPCTEIAEEGYSCSSPTDPVSGQVTVTGSSGAFRVSGNCSCGPYSAEFSLPLTVL